MPSARWVFVAVRLVVVVVGLVVVGGRVGERVGGRVGGRRLTGTGLEKPSRDPG